MIRSLVATTTTHCWPALVMTSRSANLATTPSTAAVATTRSMAALAMINSRAVWVTSSTNPLVSLTTGLPPFDTLNSFAIVPRQQLGIDRSPRSQERGAAHLSKCMAGSCFNLQRRLRQVTRSVSEGGRSRTRGLACFVKHLPSLALRVTSWRRENARRIGECGDYFHESLAGYKPAPRVFQ